MLVWQSGGSYYFLKLLHLCYFMLIRKALSWDQLVLICLGLFLVKIKQCCTPFPQTAIKLEMIIYSSVFQRCSVGSEAALSWALFTYTHREVWFSIPRNLNLKWKPQMQSVLTSGCYQILLSIISKPISQQYGFFFFPPQLKEKRCRVTAITADQTGREGTLQGSAEAAAAPLLGLLGVAASLFCIKSSSATLSSSLGLCTHLRAVWLGKTQAKAPVDILLEMWPLGSFFLLIEGKGYCTRQCW